MTAWTELLHNQALGEAGALELYRTVRAAALARNFPPPEGHAVWTVDAVMETAHDFLTSPKATDRLAYIALTADDEDSFGRLLATAVANYLRSEGRRTAVGKIVIRLKELLDPEHGFMVVPSGTPGAGNISLAAAPVDAIWSGDTGGLLAAAYAVDDVTVVRWRPDTRREPPLSDAASLRAVSAAVLTAAAGSMSFGELAAVVGRRFGLGPTSLVTLTDEPDVLVAADTEVTDNSMGAATGTGDIQAAAAELLAGMSPRQRLVMAWLSEPLSVIADRTGIARSTAGWTATRLRNDLATRLRDDTDADAIVIETQRQAKTATDQISRPANDHRSGGQ